MNDVATVLVIGILFVGLPILILTLRDRRAASHRSMSPKPDDRERERRLLNPDWSLVQRHLQRAVPPELRRLYADRSLVIRCDLHWSDELTIGAFEPLDKEALARAADWLGFEAVAIASTDSGDAIYLIPGADERDAVYLTHHDGGDTEVFADSVAVMLTRLRSA